MARKSKTSNKPHKRTRLKYDAGMILDFWEQLRMEVLSRTDGFRYLDPTEVRTTHPQCGAPLDRLLNLHGVTLLSRKVLKNDGAFTSEQMCQAEKAHQALNELCHDYYLMAMRMLKPLFDEALKVLEYEPSDAGITQRVAVLPASYFLTPDGPPEIAREI